MAALERGPRRQPAPGERLARTIDLSERQAHRHCLAAMGYGPRAFAGIVRFQRFLELADAPGPCSLAVLAAASGHAGQSHLTRESHRLAGVTPARLLAERAG